MKKALPFLLIFSLLAGCAPYRFGFQENGARGSGYYIRRGTHIIDEYVIGQDGKYPSELSVAKERFMRRKDTVENWYKKHNPDFIEKNILVSAAKAIVFAPSFPFSVIAMVVNPKVKPSGDKAEAGRIPKEGGNIEYIKAKKELLDYIERDCKIEQRLENKVD